ncbi:MAG TPA: secondary thiamine-phosphate synthase enzyme YjbQ [Candidatus Saccharimonadales bacterium]|nr:secondary thiamine-phosphate synthase enzyme YjbQ [Candidatus Saccharimonadales bacterium]
MILDVINVSTGARAELLDITARLEAWVSARRLREGVLTVLCPHTTAGLTVNEGYDPDVAADIVTTLTRLVPRDRGYRHAEGNSDAHILSTLVGTSVRVLVRGGRLDLGRWQAVFFCEFDGPRARECRLAFEGEAG